MKNSQLFAYFGHHKCATNWIHAIISSCCESLGFKSAIVHSPRHFQPSFSRFIHRNQIDFISYSNAQMKYILPLKHLQAFHVIRDPRDLIISAYFSHRYSHSTADFPTLATHRERLNGVDNIEVIFLEMEFSKNILRHLLEWEYHHSHILEIKMEDLTGKPLAVFTEIFAHLGLIKQICLIQLADTLQKNSFFVLSGGRKQGEEDTHSHYRRGLPGDWKNHFNVDHKQYFKNHFGHLLIKLNYETGEDW